MAKRYYLEVADPSDADRNSGADEGKWTLVKSTENPEFIIQELITDINDFDSGSMSPDITNLWYRVRVESEKGVDVIN